MANFFEPPRYIAVEGPIRVGKSTLSRVIAERLHGQLIHEPEDNHFLGAFYEGEPGAAFQAQFSFLIQRFEQMQQLEIGPNSRKVVVADYIFEKDKIFAYLNLTDAEVAVYDHYLDEVVKAYEHFFFHYTSSDLLVVNTSEIDFVERSDDLQQLLRRVSE